MTEEDIKCCLFSHSIEMENFVLNTDDHVIHNADEHRTVEKSNDHHIVDHFQRYKSMQD